MKQVMQIRPMNPSDIPAVCAMHIRVLPTTIARIGLPYLCRIYGELLRDPALHKALVAVWGSTIVGAITATTNGEKTQQKLHGALFHPQTIWGICTALFGNRITLFEVFDRFYTAHQIRAQFPHPYATILTFFVDTPWQHHGIAKNLLHALQQQLPRRTKLSVDTEISNTHAQQWYRTHGFRTVKTIRNTVIFYQK